MSLEKYDQKRNFNETDEPKGKVAPKHNGLRFVVQRHEASKLHYDFRLEMEGVLKSWAVPKGPSMSPGDKRLAMMVEDHPFAYRTFEGDIPAGNYGAGHVAIWDEGTYISAVTDDKAEMEEELLKGLEKGSIKVVLKGKKLQGEFSLIQMRGRQENAWLLIKKGDEHAVEEYNAEDYAGKSFKKTEKSSPKKVLKTTPKKSAKSGLKNNDKPGLELHGIHVPITNPDKVYWPDEGYTKGDVIAYYQMMAKYILPYLQNRAESLNRHPNGIDEKGFYQKDVSDSVPEWVETVEVFSESNGREIQYLVCQNEATLAYMNNLGCIEINPWNSRIETIDKPDWIVIDLDPSDKNTFDEVIETAKAVKKVLDKAKVEVFLKTSGATGLHIYIPLGAKYTFEQGKDFAQLIAQMTHEQLPDLTSLERSPKDRRNQIYVDYLQNRSAQTLAAPYSLRPKPGATVSTPLKWSELKKGLHPSKFTIANTFKRVKRVGDIFKGVLGEGIDMKKALKELGE
ncbi:MAG: non-homologous end-joining DNA ligase [Bacteroidota bacterium]